MRPLRVAGLTVVRQREGWSVIDRWWTNKPERREYMNVELSNGMYCTLIRAPGAAWDLYPDAR